VDLKARVFTNKIWHRSLPPWIEPHGRISGGDEDLYATILDGKRALSSRGPCASDLFDQMCGDPGALGVLEPCWKTRPLPKVMVSTAPRNIYIERKGKLERCAGSV